MVRTQTEYDDKLEQIINIFIDRLDTDDRFRSAKDMREKLKELDEDARESNKEKPRFSKEFLFNITDANKTPTFPDYLN